MLCPSSWIQTWCPVLAAISHHIGHTCNISPAKVCAFWVLLSSFQFLLQEGFWVLVDLDGGIYSEFNYNALWIDYLSCFKRSCLEHSSPRSYHQVNSITMSQTFQRFPGQLMYETIPEIHSEQPKLDLCWSIIDTIWMLFGRQMPDMSSCLRLEICCCICWCIFALMWKKDHKKVVCSISSQINNDECGLPAGSCRHYCKLCNNWMRQFITPIVLVMNTTWSDLTLSKILWMTTGQ